MSSPYLDLLLKDIGAPSLAPAARAAILQLWAQIPGKPDMQDELELVVYAGALLHEQDRVQDVLSARVASGEHCLQKHEQIWTALYPHLLRCGYRLGARYAPGWRCNANASTLSYDEAKPLHKSSYRAMPATHIPTGEEMFVKILFHRPGHPSAREREILEFLNAPAQRSDPRNVCVPVHEFLECPPLEGTPAPYSLVVMPSLTGYETLRAPVERLDVLRQALHGLAFLHEHGVAHRDLCCLNTMFSRDGASQRPRLFFIDFGLATWFAPGTTSRLVTWNEARQPLPELAKDKTVAYDAFKADVYACGVVFQPSMFIPGCNLVFMNLYAWMKAPSPDDRPSPSDALRLLDALVEISPWRQEVPTDDFATLMSSECGAADSYPEQQLSPGPLLPSHPFLPEVVL